MPDLTGYTHSQLISVTGNKPASSQSWFPMLVAFDADTGLNDYTQNAGLDIALTLDGDDTELPYDREEWTDNGANIDARFWVRVPSIDSASDTDLRMHIGKAAGTAYATPEDTWNENGAGNFEAVWHLNNVLTDSTGKGHTLTNSGATGSATGGKIVGCYLFDDAASDYLEIAEAVVNAYPITMSAWFKTDVFANQTPLCIGSNAEDHMERLLTRDPPGSDVVAQTRDGAAWITADTIANYALNVWQKGDAILAAANDRRVFLNGANKQTSAVNYAHPVCNRTNIGCSQALGSGRYLFMSGYIEEARLSTVARSDAWVGFEYDNVADYAGTITHGSWESTAAGIVILRRRLEGY